MNIYHPFILSTIDREGKTTTMVVKNCYLSFYSYLSEQLYRGDISSYSWRKLDLIELEKVGQYVSGFLLQPERKSEFMLDKVTWYAIDLRVNEGMNFSADTKEALTDMIEDYLLGCAKEYQKDLDRKATQAARVKV